MRKIALLAAAAFAALATVPANAQFNSEHADAVLVEYIGDAPESTSWQQQVQGAKSVCDDAVVYLLNTQERQEIFVACLRKLLPRTEFRVGDMTSAEDMRHFFSEDAEDSRLELKMVYEAQ